jgi:hypothetical protein
VVTLHQDVIESRAAAFRTDIAAMLQENASLESLSIRRYNLIEAEEYVELITVLQHNTTLKTLILQHYSRVGPLTNDEEQQMAVVLKKNYGLERLPDINQENEAGDVGAILRLNEAGRRYLVQDGSSISKGVEVLCAVSNEINCVFLHLLENPRLCDRSAVEMVSSGQSNCTSRNPTNSGGGKKGTSQRTER